MNTQKFKNNGRNKFPISTDTLDFMQEQIKLLYGFVSLAGQNIIISMPLGNTPGLVIVNGELLPLTGSPNSYITIKESNDPITFLGETINRARTTRTALFTSYSAGANSYTFSSFVGMRTNRQLQLDLESAKQHHTPKGTVIDWYGEASYENIPYGWVPCGGFFMQTGDNAEQNATEEKSKWETRYPGMSISLLSAHGGMSRYLKITSVNNINVPDLSGRFVVGAGFVNDGLRYNANDTGGSNAVTLTADQSGLPAHTHNADSSLNKSRFKHIGSNGGGEEWIFDKDSGSENVGNLTVSTSIGNPKIGDVIYDNGKGSTQSHENRPPYYALYKLIKVI